MPGGLYCESPTIGNVTCRCAFLIYHGTFGLVAVTESIAGNKQSIEPMPLRDDLTALAVQFGRTSGFDIREARFTTRKNGDGSKIHQFNFCIWFAETKLALM